MALTHELVARACESGIEPLIDPVTNVLVLDVPDADSVRSDLKKRGWDVSITRDPRALRLVIMPHLSRENLNLFADDLADVVKWMSAN